jgi:flagellar hook-associated protein 1 FlgK
MSGISSIMNTALMGMMTYQTAISVTTNNIANVDPDGYSKQVGGHQGQRPLSGAEVTAITRIFDQFCQAKINDSASGLGKAETEEQYLEYVEALFDETESDGLSDGSVRFLELLAGIGQRSLEIYGAANVFPPPSPWPTNFNQNGE